MYGHMVESTLPGCHVALVLFKYNSCKPTPASYVVQLDERACDLFRCHILAASALEAFKKSGQSSSNANARCPTTPSFTDV